MPYSSQSLDAQVGYQTDAGSWFPSGGAFGALISTGLGWNNGPMGIHFPSVSFGASHKGLLYLRPPTWAGPINTTFARVFGEPRVKKLWIQAYLVTPGTNSVPFDNSNLPANRTVILDRPYTMGFENPDAPDGDAVIDSTAVWSDMIHTMFQMAIGHPSWTIGDDIAIVIDWDVRYGGGDFHRPGPTNNGFSWPGASSDEMDTTTFEFALANEPSSIVDQMNKGVRWFDCPRCGHEFPISRAVRDGERRTLWVCDTGCADKVGRRDLRRHVRRERRDLLWPQI